MMRDQYLALFKSKIESYADGASQDSINTVARRLERGCFNKTIEICTLEFIPRVDTEPRYIFRYSTECYRILGCINDQLTKKLLSEEIDSREVSNMSSVDLRPDVTQEIRDMIEIRRNQQVTEKYAREKCRRCGAARVIYILALTKAADEIASFHHKCRECGFTWGKS